MAHKAAHRLDLVDGVQHRAVVPVEPSQIVGFDMRSAVTNDNGGRLGKNFLPSLSAPHFNHVLLAFSLAQDIWWRVHTISHANRWRSNGY